jgi:citrate synthase
MAEFSTRISRVLPGRIDLRGYPAEEVIRHASAGETLFLILVGRRPDRSERRVFDAILACCADHGFVNSASVAGRYVMSGSGSLPAAMAAGILAFGESTGTAHLTADMLRQIGSGHPADVTDERIRSHVTDLRARRTPIPGLGHPLHRTVDPREAALRAVVAEAGFVSPHVELLDRIRLVTNEVTGRTLVLNVDGLFGALLLDMGFPPDAIFAVNIIGAMPGIAAHAIEERESGRKLRIPPERDVSYDAVASGLRWTGEGP